MKTAIFTGPKRIEIREIELPSLQPGQVLVRVKAVGLCTWEQRFYRGSHAGSYPFRGGHEVSGEVVEVGPQAKTGVRVGDAVCLALKTRCGSCYYCRRGLDNFCQYEATAPGSGQAWGPAGLSEYVIAEDYQVYPAKPRLPFEQLALAEPVACVARSVSLPPLRLGDLAIVQGVGIMGLLHVQLLKQRAVRVLVAEPDPQRREAARAAGADFALDPLATDLAAVVYGQTEGIGAQAVFFTAGGGLAIQQGLAALAKGGWLCLYGSVYPKGPIGLDPNEIHYKELFLSGTFSHTNASFYQAVEMIGAGLVDLSPYVSACIPFPEVKRGFELAIRPDTYRVVVTF